MPKTRRKPRPRPEPDGNARELRKLALFLEQGDGFRLGLVTTDTHPTRQRELDRLSAAVADRPVHLTRLELGSTLNEELLLRRLEAHLAEHPTPEGKTPAVMVLGIESLLDYRELDPGTPNPQPILRNANAQRDAYPRLCPAAVVLWLLPTATAIFAREAPDLWHWRSGTFDFDGPKVEKLALEMLHANMRVLERERLTVGEKGERIALLREILQELRSSDDRDTDGNKARCAELLMLIGREHSFVSSFNSAIECFVEAVELFRAVGDLRGESASLGELGNINFNRGFVEEAIAIYKPLLQIAESSKDAGNMIAAYGNLGNAFAEKNDFGQAITNYENALTLTVRSENLMLQGRTLNSLGNVLLASGKINEAIEKLDGSLEIARRVSDPNGESGALANLGRAHGFLGQSERALAFFEQALPIAKRIGDCRGEGLIYCCISAGYAGIGQTTTSLNFAKLALQVGSTIHDPRIIQVATGLIESLKFETADVQT